MQLRALIIMLLVVAMPVCPGAQELPQAQCIDSLRYIPLPADLVGIGDDGVPALGNYERISPDGRFVLRSYSGARLGQVSLIELPQQADEPVRAYLTGLSNEAFPVQGSWRYLVDITGRHYRFRDVLRHGADAKPLFRGGMSGFYAAASELPQEDEQQTNSGGPEEFEIRSLSWPQGNRADRQGVGPMQMTTLRVRDDGDRATVLREDGPHFICANRVSSDGSAFALPMLSVDGLAFSAIPQNPGRGRPTMRVYRLQQQGRAWSCMLEKDMGVSASKAVFGFPQPIDHPARLAYSDIGRVYFYDPELDESFALDHGRHGVLASAFPGMTRDGRIVYAATWRECEHRADCKRQAGYVVADPYQSRAWQRYWRQRQLQIPRTCITRAEVARERTVFARQHGLD